MTLWAMGSVHDQLAKGRKIGVLIALAAFSLFSTSVQPRESIHIKWLGGQKMRNVSLCDRLGADRRNAAQMSAVIKEAMRAGYLQSTDLDYPQPGDFPVAGPEARLLIGILSAAIHALRDIQQNVENWWLSPFSGRPSFLIISLPADTHSDKERPHKSIADCGSIL